jgi:hypothetical protein
MVHFKKKTAAALSLVIASYTGGAHATLNSDAVLDFDPATSFFGMEVAPGFIVPTALTSQDGIKLGVVQTPAGSHGGAPDGSETPTVDQPWLFFSNTGMHGTVGDPITIVSDDGNGNVTLDMTGWRVDWNGVVINMGTGADATVVCTDTNANTIFCDAGDTYVLDYAAIVPDDGTTNFGGVSYTLRLEGAISDAPFFNSVPVANDDDADGNRVAPIIIDVLVNDSDDDGSGDFDRSSVTVVTDVNPVSGSTSVDTATGNITFTPATVALNDIITFTYNFTDLGGPLGAGFEEISNDATVTITIKNIPPVAVDDSNAIDVSLNSSVLTDVASNDTDSDGTVVASTVTIINDVTNGTTVNEGNGSVTYTPDAGFIGIDTFTYTVQDNDMGVSNEATVVITVSDSTITGLPDDAFLILNAGNGNPGEGSLFSMEVNPGQLTYTGITGFNHIQLGTEQLASVVMPNIDEPWLFFGALGVHQTTSPVTKLSDDGAGNVTLDFSGWDVSWNKIPSIPLGNGADNGIATLTCATTCAVGEVFTLIYRATVPPGDPSGFGGVQYILELDGVISDGDPCVGGCDSTVPYDVTTISAVEDSTASPTVPVAVAPGATAIAAGNTTGVHLTAADIASKDPLLNDADGVQCLGGCVDFIAADITSDFIDIVIVLTDPIQEGSIYRKLINGKWQGFDTAGSDQLGSADSDASGNCQGPAGVFQVGLRAGAKCIFMRIYDGGSNDADGDKNGTIVDPGGVLLAGSPNVPAGYTESAISGLSWMLVSILFSIMGLARIKRT